MSSSVPQRLGSARSCVLSVFTRTQPAAAGRSTTSRLARVLVPAGLAAALIGGCQAQPGAAAFVGSDRIPQSEVDSLTASSLKAVNRSVSQSDTISLRQTVTSQLVIGALVDTRLKQLGLTVTDAQVQRQIDTSAQQAGGEKQFYAQQAQQGLSPTLLKMQVRAQLGLTAIQQRIGAANPTENELRAAYEANGGQAAIGQSFAQVRDQLVQYVQGQKLQADLTQLAKSSHVRINPRNGTFDVTSLSVKAGDNGLVSTSGTT